MINKWLPIKIPSLLLLYTLLLFASQDYEHRLPWCNEPLQGHYKNIQ